ncbi:hypothetical protein H2200_002745 [Cladophialophora chaetospira]|uniref:Heterokaryon incompatibility domain-containing protein n=1 Tax=Cladophialophora chaetospira TaxID=386627 RepID=A0AA38XJP4_9EURO|nr:hypothetical protein H2200_002745 [Cladophialophora chaetospira]
MSKIVRKVHLPRELTPCVDPSQPQAKLPPLKKQGVDSTRQNPGGHDDLDHPEFDNNSRWPRRLLHVPTMISHKWQTGNTFAGIANPEYSIISYTWGRWRIRDPNSTIESLNVKGVPWNIPKVDPTKHFSANQFKQVLDLIVDHSTRISTERRALPFVWLDIACIPQWDDSTIAASEVGRQARIFRGAQNAYVWLTEANPAELDELVWESDGNNPEERARYMKFFCNLLSDPSFGSMWTLQESFIQQGGYVVTSAELGKVPSKERLVELYEIRGVADNLLHQNGHDYTGLQDVVTKFQDMWHRTGMQSPPGTSPMHILASAQHRECEYELDRVYGIMQIFGDDFRVGKARVALDGSSVGLQHKFTLEELEDELGDLILKTFPYTSQLFQHDRPAFAGKAWRVCDGTSVPTGLAMYSGTFTDGISAPNQDAFLAKADCRLSTIEDGSVKWAKFQGKVCRFDRVVQCSRSTKFVPTWTECYTYLDAGPDMSTFDATDIDEVLRYYGHDTLMVLLFGVRNHSDSLRSVGLGGLLLLAPGQKALALHKSRREWHPKMEGAGIRTWARVGVCQIEWSENRSGDGSYMSGPETDTLMGISDDWIEQEGIWG